MSKPSRPSLIAVLTEAKKSLAEINAALEKAGFEKLSDQERAAFEAERTALINSMASKPTDEINAALVAAGFDKLGEGEIAALCIMSKMSEDAKAAKAESDTQAAIADAASDGKPAKKKSSKAEKGDKLKAALLAVVGSKDGKPVTQAHAMVTGMLYQMVDILRVVEPAKYAEYRTIKYPGGVESLATPETKRKAYLFAVETLFNLFKV